MRNVTWIVQAILIGLLLLTLSGQAFADTPTPTATPEPHSPFGNCDIIEIHWKQGENWKVLLDCKSIPATDTN